MHEEAAAVLRDVLGWELSASGWIEVQRALDRLAVSRDLDRDLGSLEVSGPFRIVTRVGDEPVAPIPEHLRERVNELIHSLVIEPEKADDDG